MKDDILMGYQGEKIKIPIDTEHVNRRGQKVAAAARLSRQDLAGASEAAAKPRGFAWSRHHEHVIE